VIRQDWPVSPVGLTALYAEAAGRFGFPSGHEHELEALARLDCGGDASPFDGISYRDGRVEASPGWAARLERWLAERPASDVRHRARVAGAFQRHLGGLLVQIAGDVRRSTGQTRLCVGGGLFFNTCFTTVLEESGVFDAVFVPPNPGNAGVSVGAALAADDNRPHRPHAVSPFLGASYSPESIKRTLDNCKLSYECVDEGAITGVAVDALVRGQLVGWFQGRMEWGHRALGHRSILASPLSPYVLENLNVFLKHRAQHIAYGVSVPEEHAGTFFTGPAVSRFMEFEHQPRDPDRLRAIVPGGTRAIRVQTIARRTEDEASLRYRRLHEAFGAATGTPVLVNTSFNGFSEPMVCSPRDAIRVFFGSGLDLLVLDRFVIRK
jgi:carbamoyltransferase